MDLTSRSTIGITGVITWRIGVISIFREASLTLPASLFHIIVISIAIISVVAIVIIAACSFLDYTRYYCYSGFGFRASGLRA